MNHNNVPMTEILPYLYLGNRSDANNVNGLTKNGIGFILNLTTSATEYPQESNIISRHINILDSVYQCLKDTYQSAFDFIDEARKCNSKILIHCEAGISRSPTITVAYLIYKKRMEALEAYNFVKKLRPIVSPNFGFMGQLMELENELLPEKVAIRLEKEAKLQIEANKLKEEERLKEINNQQESVVVIIENKNVQFNKPIRNATKPNTLSLEPKSRILPKPLSLKLFNSVLPNAANKYVLPSTTVQSNLVQQQKEINSNVSNQNLSPNINSNCNVNSSCEPLNQNLIQQQPKTNSPSNNQQTSSSSLSSSIKFVIQNSSNDCLKDNQTKPKLTSQSSDCIIKKLDTNQIIIDSNNNITPSSDNENVKMTLINSDKSIDTNKSNEIKIDKSSSSSEKPLLIDSKNIDKIESTVKVLIKPDNLIANLLQNNGLQQLNNNNNITRSVPSSNVCTPSNKQPTINLSELLNPNIKSISQNNLFTDSNSIINSNLTAKIQVKPLRPSTLLLPIDTNVSRGIKNNAITPSSLCSPLTAFAVSSTKSSPTINFSSNLSSPLDTNEKMTKRRWLGNETNCSQEFNQDFSPPECKKKNKQKKLKNNISVEVN